MNKKDERVLTRSQTVKIQQYDHDKSIIVQDGRYTISKTDDHWRFQYWKGRQRLNLRTKVSDKEAHQKAMTDMEEVRSRLVFADQNPPLPQTIYVRKPKRGSCPEMGF